jgi:hypothetical protein
MFRVLAFLKFPEYFIIYRLHTFRYVSSAEEITLNPPAKSSVFYKIKNNQQIQNRLQNDARTVKMTGFNIDIDKNSFFYGTLQQIRQFPQLRCFPVGAADQTISLTGLIFQPLLEDGTN